MGRLVRGGHYIAERHRIGWRRNWWYWQVCTCGWKGRGSSFEVEARSEGRVHVLGHQWD